METAKQDAFDRARLEVIRDGYERAFECINKGLAEDETGHKAEALKLYRQGRQHLLRALSVPSHSEECVGPLWDSARQMQQKMQETLSNITTRLAVLETTVDPLAATSAPSEPSGLMGESAPQNLYPEVPRVKPQRPAPPKGLSPGSQPSGAVSEMSLGAGGAVSGLPPLPGFSPDQPPAYSPQAADGHLSISYGTTSGELSLVGEDFYSPASSSAPSLQSLGEDGEELFFLPQGVQIFFVTAEGQVSAPSYPGYLRIVKFTNECSERARDRPPAFLQVCDWLYPLMASDSPVLLCTTGVYMFPDLMAPTEGSYVGVVLASELPQSDRELFHDLLEQMTDLRVQDSDGAADIINLGQKVPMGPPEEMAPPTEGEEVVLPEWSGKVAHGIFTGASWLSWGLVKGAEYTGKAIHKGASKLRQHITPEDKPTYVSPTVTKSLHVAKQATGGAVKVSQFLVDGLCTVASHVGKELAPHVKKHGSKLLPESMKKDKDGRSNVDGAMVVAASGIQGFAAVWTGLEVAAKNIAKSIAAETVSTVQHKYGVDAGQATDHAVNSAINVGKTAFNIDNLGIKAIVKKTGKETASAILKDYKVQEESDTNGDDEKPKERK